MSFDNENYSKDLAERCLNPFRAGRCLSTEELKKHLAVLTRLNPFRAGRCLSTLDIGKQLKTKRSLNPFRAGRCLSTELKSLWNEYARSQSLSSRAMSFDRTRISNSRIRKSVSIPFEQGDVFRQNWRSQGVFVPEVSIPFEQGDVFRLQRYAGGRNHAAFQTHFPIFLEG